MNTLVDYQQKSSARMLLEINQTCTTMTVFKDGQPYFIHNIANGLQQVHKRAGGSYVKNSDRSDLISSNPDRGVAFEGLRLPGATATATSHDLHSALQEACDLYARELTQEVMLCMHYLEEFQPAGSCPNVGSVIGAGAMEQLIIRSLNESTDTVFQSLEDIWPISTQKLMHSFTNTLPCDMWLLPLGLAFYGIEHVLERKAA